MRYVSINIIDSNNATATYRDGYSINIYSDSLDGLNYCIDLLITPLGYTSSKEYNLAMLASNEVTKDIDISLLDKIA